MWKNFVDTLIYQWLGLSGKFAEAFDFFIYDTVKIFTLLVVIIFVITLIRSYFPIERVRDYLATKHPLVGHILAALFGIITPFCSCSAIPLFLGFLQARIPLGITFSYLISAPMNNEIAIALLFALFGWKITALYIGFGLLVAIAAGIIIGKIDLEDEILIKPKPINAEAFEAEPLPLKDRAIEAWYHTMDLLKKIWLYVVIAVAIGGFIHGYVPTDFIVQLAGKDAWYAVPLATLLGVPMYSNAAGVLPLIEVLVDKGMSLGTALSFMMAITALSLPEAMILKKIMSTKLLLIFFGVVSIGIMVIGYLFNWILG
ncbi:MULTISPECIES: permease [unclassified Nitratiruptor]|uniref:permease n=1 Tax=unclassified Nitratiruptor TaxID=2624044 RepID=UPI001915A828|nr:MULTISPECIES: permease [unclassified Nitratiruptor]BCD59296.1 hypothetical protein NitYY0810_C0026 [Nitratiruptor sp. YY08-10]BCD63220.1 hypothetical protein NitYY0814_C0026 [Nitratiruptor sp. YY08-14]